MAHLPDGIYEYTKAQRVIGAPDIPRRVTFRRGQMVELIEFCDEVPPRFYAAYEYDIICEIAREIALQRRYGGERVRVEPLPEPASEVVA